MTRHKIFLNRLSGGLTQELFPILERARDLVLSRVFQENVDFDALRDEVSVVLDELRERLDINMIEFLDYESDFFRRILSIEANEEVSPADRERMINKLTAKTMPIGLAGKKQNKKLDTAVDQFIKSKSEEFVRPLQEAEVIGDTPETVASNLSLLVGGTMLAQLGALSSTAITHGEMVAHEEVLRNNKNIIKKEEWVSILDSRTTEYCQNQDGKIYNVGEGPTPPAHFNCRSLRVAIV